MPDDKIRERIVLLKRYLYHMEWDYPNDVKSAVVKYLYKDASSAPYKLDIEELSKLLSDGQIKDLMKFSPVIQYRSFRGRYYTVKDGSWQLESSWDEVRNSVKEILQIHGKKGYSILKALVEIGEGPFDLVAAKASEVLGDRYYPSHLIAEVRDRWDLAWEVGSNKYPAWAMPDEVKPCVVQALEEFESKPIPRLSTEQAEHEFLDVIRMEEDFRGYLGNLLRNRLDETIKFGKEISPQYIIDYIQRLFGLVLFFDHLLSITQQYSIADTEIISEGGHRASRTGFNLALFGEPGSGKTFAIKDMMLGNDNLGVPAHGLPNRNRYCGGMTPAMFIAIGEAYTDRRFNFIVTEFNDWFKYKGMVEPLKLAMERGNIRYETKTYTVGSYPFTSFFSVNYNTQVREKGYEVTVSDPNFNAIEDRMLCRLHRLTKERYRELSKSQRDLMLGVMRPKMKVASQVRDHLTLIHAIQTKDPQVVGMFPDRKILLTQDMLNMLENAVNLVMEHLGETKVVPFSMRLEQRAIQLASALSLLNYFRTHSDVIKLDPVATRMAVQFFVEEAWVRSNESFSLTSVLKQLALSES